MAMTVRRLQQQHTAVQTFNRVEAIADGAVIVDGVMLDLRGALKGASIYDHVVEWGPHEKYVLINRDPDDGSWLCTVATTHTGAATSVDTVISSYPHGIIGNTGQLSVTQSPISITQSVGLREAFRETWDWFVDFVDHCEDHRKFLFPGDHQRMNIWQFWFCFHATYVVANHSGYTFQQKMTWAEKVRTFPFDIDGVGNGEIENYVDLCAQLISMGNPPSTAHSWVNPTTGDKTLVKLANLYSLPAVIPRNYHVYFRGAWIDSLTA